MNADAKYYGDSNSLAAGFKRLNKPQVRCAPDGAATWCIITQGDVWCCVPSAVLMGATNLQMERLQQLLNENIEIDGAGNFPEIILPLRHFVVALKRQLV